MIITYYGKQFFKIQQGEIILALNPISKNSKSKSSAHFGADLAFVTTNHPDYNGIEQLSHGDKEPFVINAPGDYEVKNIFVKGIMSQTEIEKKKYINTIYYFSLDNINILFLGALSNFEINKEVNEVVNNLDIIFVPVNPENIKELVKFINALEPKIIIPTDYDDVSLKLFLKEIGGENAEKVDKLTLKRKDLDSKDGEVIILNAI